MDPLVFIKDGLHLFLSNKGASCNTIRELAVCRLELFIQNLLLIFWMYLNDFTLTGDYKTRWRS